MRTAEDQAERIVALRRGAPSARACTRRRRRGEALGSRLRMPYDEELVNRLRELLADEDAVTEKKMFGGLAFLIHGNMSVSASRTGGLLVRIDPDDTDSALGRAHAGRMKMGGRTMDGWIIVAPAGLTTKRQLAAWVTRSVSFAKTLPRK
jgi:TfoX/Sxy family transcriptional regulator of competence genes